MSILRAILDDLANTASPAQYNRATEAKAELAELERERDTLRDTAFALQAERDELARYHDDANGIIRDMEDERDDLQRELDEARALMERLQGNHIANMSPPLVPDSGRPEGWDELEEPTDEEAANDTTASE